MQLEYSGRLFFYKRYGTIYFGPGEQTGIMFNLCVVEDVIARHPAEHHVRWLIRAW